jgi:Transposase DDE domain group 1
MNDPMLPLPGLSSVSSKRVVANFDGGLLSSDGGVLALREVEQRLRIADRLAACVVDSRAPDQVTHSFADIIRFRLMMIAAGYEDGIDANSLRSDPMFKMALDLTPSDRELCSQSTISRLENLPDVRALLRMGRAMVDLYCNSFACVPNRITLDIDDTFDAVHGGQQLSLFNAHYDEYGFQPIVVFDGEGRFITAMLRPAKRPSGKEIKPFLRRLFRAIRVRWPRTEICCAPTALIARPRFSTSVGPTASTTSSASRRLRRCVGMSWNSKPRRKLGSRPRLGMASYAASKSSSTARKVGAGSSASSPALKSARRDPTHASSSPI